MPRPGSGRYRRTLKIDDGRARSRTGGATTRLRAEFALLYETPADGGPVWTGRRAPAGIDQTSPGLRPFGCLVWPPPAVAAVRGDLARPGPYLAARYVYRTSGGRVPTPSSPCRCQRHSTQRKPSATTAHSDAQPPDYEHSDRTGRRWPRHLVRQGRRRPRDQPRRPGRRLDRIDAETCVSLTVVFRQPGACGAGPPPQPGMTCSPHPPGISQLADRLPRRRRPWGANRHLPAATPDSIRSCTRSTTTPRRSTSSCRWPSPERSRFCPAPNPTNRRLERIMVGDQGLGRVPE